MRQLLKSLWHLDSGTLEYTLNEGPVFFPDEIVVLLPGLKVTTHCVVVLSMT